MQLKDPKLYLKTLLLSLPNFYVSLMSPSFSHDKLNIKTSIVKKSLTIYVILHSVSAGD